MIELSSGIYNQMKQLATSGTGLAGVNLNYGYNGLAGRTTIWKISR